MSTNLKFSHSYMDGQRFQQVIVQSTIDIIVAYWTGRFQTRQNKKKTRGTKRGTQTKTLKLLNTHPVDLHIGV